MFWKKQIDIFAKCFERNLFLAAVNEFQLKGQFIEGSSNRISDILSRWHLFIDRKVLGTDWRLYTL